MIRSLASLALLTMLLSCQSNAPLAEYESKSSQEEAIKGILLDFETAVIQQDEKKLEGLIHDDASIMIGRDRKVLSKTQYAGILADRLAENASIWLGTPKMSVSGDRAVVKIYMSRGGGKFLMTFHMVMEKGNWAIAGWEY